MTDKEQLAGYDEGGTDRTAELRAPESPPGVPAASSPELRTLVAIAVGAIVVSDVVHRSGRPHPDYVGCPAVICALSAC
jgi:hypothetical protein